MTHQPNSDTPEEVRFPTMTFTVADPRTFDGDAYEVAERALNQAAAVAAVLEQMLDAADKMARNAEMERAFAFHEEPKGSEWRGTPQGRALAGVMANATAARKALKVLTQAAGYNPRKPVR